MRSTTCNGNALFVENKVYESYTLYNKKRDLSVEKLCGKIRHFQKFGCGNIFLVQS